jgi:ABC-type nitrate/sulfonate/bicarbonate transport system permease component
MMSSAARRKVDAAAQVIAPALSVALAVGLWEVAPRLGWVDSNLLPPFSKVIGQLPALLRDGSFASSIAASAQRWAIGVVLAVLIGVPLGLAMGRRRAVANLMNPILAMTYTFPKAALILVLVLWFGIGNGSMIAVIVLGCFAPIVISAYHGAKSVNPHLVWSAQTLGVSRPAALLKVVLPAAMPQILSGLRIAMIVSLFTVLSSELLIRRNGIGTFLFNNLDAGQYLVVYAGSLLIATFGFVLDFLYVRTVRIAAPWADGEV